MGLHMNRYIKTALLAGAAWGALSTMVVAQDAPAQTQDEAAAVGDVIVTARRRDEALKDVPISVSALGAERLEALVATGANHVLVNPVGRYVEHVEALAAIVGLS